MITQERLKQVLDYDPETGAFVWIARGRGIRTGRRAGSVDAKTGYRVIRIDGEFYYAQRLAWLYVHGASPQRLRFQNESRDDCSIGNLAEGFRLDTEHDHSTKEGRSAYQREYRGQRREHYSHKERERRFALSLADYAAMVAEHENKCAICRHPETATRNGKLKALAVDHDHATGNVRGLLCSDCNTGIGKLKDSRDVLLAAVRYLDKHAGAENVVTLVRKDQA